MGGIELVSGLGGFSLPSLFGATVSLSSPSYSVLFPVSVTELFSVIGLPFSPLQPSILPEGSGPNDETPVIILRREISRLMVA